MKKVKILWGITGMVLAASLFALPARAAERAWTGNEWNVSEEEMSRVENLKIGREDARSSFFSFSDKEAALNSQQTGKERNLDDAWYQPLDTAAGQTWKFYYVSYPGARKARPDNANIMNPDYDDSGWDEITVPKNWEASYNEDKTFKYNPPQYSNTDYAWQSQNPNPQAPHAPTQFNPVGFYRTKIDVDPSFQNRSVFLNFDGVESAFYLWVNGHKVGFSEDSFTGKEFQIDEWLNFDGQDTIAVEVFKWSSGSWFEDQDMLTLAGIFRSVYLTSKDQVEIRDFTINTAKAGEGMNPEEDYRDFDFELYASLRSLGGEDALADGMKVDVALYDSDGNQVASDALENAELEKAVNAADFTKEDSLGRPMATVKLSARVKNPLKWSAENPNLYKALITLSDASGKLVETTAYRFGFRMVEIKNKDQSDAQILINGQPLLLKGVNVHENNYETGRAMTYELIRKDVTMMKQNNFNAIRMSHYSHDFRYYELADEIGLYICDEANVETHGNRSIPASNSKYLPAVLDRLSSMFYRSKNFPSVIILSLGNEAGSGTVFGEMNKWLKGNYEGTPDFYIDDALKGDIQGRPVHYEGDNDNADVKSNMYPGVNDVLGASNVNKPYILCEYSHAMGTSGGYYQDYWDVFESKDNIQGGFIWDWVDQSLKTFVEPEAFPAQTALGWQSGYFVSQDANRTKIKPTKGPDCWAEKGTDGAEGSYALDGAAYAETTPAALNMNSSFTLEAWVYPADLNTGQRTIIAKGDNQYKLSTTNGAIQFNTYYGSGHGWNEGNWTYDPDTWAGRWHHIVAVYDAPTKTASIYCDDMTAPKSETVFTHAAEDGTFNKSNANFAVGYDTQNNGRAWEGMIDNVRVYNTALTAEDLASERHVDDENVVYWEDFENAMESGAVSDVSNRVYTLVSQDAGKTPCTLTKKSAALTEAGVSGEEGDKALSGVAVTKNTPAALDINGTMTLEAWVYPTNESGQRVIIGKGENQYVLRTQNGSLCLQTYSDVGGKWNQLLCKYDDTWIGNWHHVAVTYDAKTKEAKMYIDDMSAPAGEAVFENVYEDGTFHKNGESFAVGRETNNLGRDWQGLIDNARVYSRALTAEELQNDARTAEDDGVVFWMDFNGTPENKIPSVSEGYMGFGGDWGDSPNSSNFCANGIVSTDRVPHGAMLDIKRVHQDYVIDRKTAGAAGAEVTVRSRALFTNASAYEFVWEVKEDGKAIRRGTQNVDLAPLAEKTISIVYDEITPKKGSVYYLDMKFVLKSDTQWAKKGHEISGAQAEIPFDTEKILAENLAKAPVLSYEESEEAYTVTGKDFTLVFNRERGTIQSFVFKGTELFAEDTLSGPAPNFWRAPTDGDRLSNISTAWRYAGRDRTNIATAIEEIQTARSRALKISVTGDLSPASGSAAYTMDFTIYGDGQILVANSMTPEGFSDRDLLPVIGNELQLDSQFEHMTWFGRGSDQEGLFSESFPDRYAKQFVGLYEDQVENQFIPYVRNQTFGNKMDVSWIAFTNTEGKGLLISSARMLFNANAQHYTQEELTSFGSKHPYESKKTDNVVINLDHKNMAVGYDPGWLDKRWYKEEDLNRPVKAYSYQYKLSPMENFTEEEAFAKSRQSYSTDAFVIPVESVTLEPDSMEMAVGETRTLTKTVLPEDADNQNVIWEIEDSEILDVENGTVTAKKEGTATITVRTEDGGYTDTCTVTVKKEISGDEADKAAAKAVEEKIAAIGTVTLESKELIEEAEALYAALTEAQKALVKNYGVLIAARETYDLLASGHPDEAAAKAVEGKIAAIVTVTLESKELIEEAEALYAALTEAQKALVKNYGVLTAAREAYNLLAGQQAADEADKAAAKAVEEKIAAIGTVTLESKRLIEEAEALYAALTEKQKALVKNYGVLTAARAAYSHLAGQQTGGGDPSDAKTPGKGTKFQSGGMRYQITSAQSGKRAVTLTGPNNKKLTKLTVPAAVSYQGQSYKVTALGKNAFKSCVRLKTVSGGKNVGSVGDQAFANCKKLASVTIEKNAASIGKKAFYQCKALKKIKVNSTKLKKVGKQALKGISKKAEIKVPKKKKRAYQRLFKNRGQAKTVKIR